MEASLATSKYQYVEDLWDDAVADGLRVDRPTEYVFIHDDPSRRGGGVISFGSETSGGIRHAVAYRNITIEDVQGVGAPHLHRQRPASAAATRRELEECQIVARMLASSRMPCNGR